MPYQTLHPSARALVDRIVVALAGAQLTPQERVRAVDMFLNEQAAAAMAQGEAVFLEEGLAPLVPTWRQTINQTAAEVRHCALERLAACDGAGVGRA